MNWQQEYKRIQAESDALRERIDKSDRIRARDRLRRGQPLTEYDKTALGAEYTEYVRRQKAVHEAARAAVEEGGRKRAILTAAIRPQHITFRSPYLEALNKHAIDLAVTHDLTVVRCEDGEQRADQESRVVYSPPVTNAAIYAVFLHETGHVVSPAADSRQYPYELVPSTGYKALIARPGEVGAWKYAIAHAYRPGWTAEMQEAMYRSLESYSHHATHDERFDMKCCLSDGALKIVGRPKWTFGLLAERGAKLMGESR